MSDPVLEQLITGLREGGPDLAADPQTLRPEYEALFATMPVAEDLAFAETELGGVPALRVAAPGVADDKVLLYLHGGGYVVGTANGYRGLAGELGRASGMTAVVLDYRLAPEHRFPAAVDDAVAAYRALVAGGTSPANIVLAGDSAGGGLALATLLKLRDAGEAMPAAALLISPWADLTGKAGSIDAKAAEDPSLTKEGLLACAAHYLGDADPADPLASPALTNLYGLPPLLVQVGSVEILLDDSLAIANSAGPRGTMVRLEVHPGLPHVFHAFHFMLPQAKAALDEAGAFLASHAK
ncbi:alpha/beta hydrolase [Aurantiacibacter sp. MUD11]|uniref:alpha/beta hydrolase n=1 Tax=Aurantiacibacter sp. MUD11 TaxID=3003265 RepID=UPI0022AAACD4|nr:alpha/beta hydrolase [Aurantiacibacter sp. MUD11]WAT19223.1 alpha/beta hydrolase [Aurantiacibacter sp. MUD11]